MERYVQTVEAFQFHDDGGDHWNGQEANGVCWGCTTQHRPHVHGLDTLQFGMSVGYEKAVRFLEEGDWVVLEGDDPNGPGVSPRVVKDAWFQAHYRPAGGGA